MLCQRCNGAGKYKNAFGDIVRCDICYGAGNVEYGENDRRLPTGEQKPLTNEERFCQLSTKEKANILFRLCNHASIFGAATSEEYEAWLKEVHNG